MQFYMKSNKGTRLRDYKEAAQELSYRVSRSDDPRARAVEPVAHAALMRVQGRELAGGEFYNPEKRWNHREVE